MKTYRQKKAAMKRAVVKSRNLFEQTQSIESTTLARACYNHWISLPDADGAGVIAVTAFGGVNLDLSYPGTLASPSLRMGHLRLFNPTTYGPCTDPFADYADNEILYLPTLETISQKVYRIPIQYLALHIDLVMGVQFASTMGTTKHNIFPLYINIETPYMTYMDSNTNTKINSILETRMRFGKDKMDCPYPPPSWYSPTCPPKPLRIRECASCHKNNSALPTCGGCRQVHYCNTGCQKDHWRVAHKKQCRVPLEKKISSSPRLSPSLVESPLALTYNGPSHQN